MNFSFVPEPMAMLFEMSTSKSSKGDGVLCSTKRYLNTYISFLYEQDVLKFFELFSQH